MLVENNSYPEDIRIYHEVMTLAGAGYFVSVISQSSPNRPWHEMLEGVDVYRYRIPISGKGFVTYLLEYSYSLLVMFLLSILVFLKSGFDVIHAANPPDTSVFIAAFYKIFRKKFIFDQHDLSPEVYLLRFNRNKKVHRLIHKILITLEKLSCRLADHVIAPNQSYKILEMERDAVPAEHITIVRNGPDLNEKVPNNIVKAIRQDGKKTLLYLGVIGFQDGVDYLLRSLYYLKYKLGRNDFVCVIAGDGNALSGLKLEASHLGLSDFIVFPGWIKSTDVPSYMNSADVCLAPEPSNDLNDRSTMVKIMEYMASSKPIVAFDLPEHRVTAQSAAIYAEANNELDFAQKIVALMDDSEKCREMGKNARERVEKELCWLHQKDHLLEAYRKIYQNDSVEAQK